MFVFMPMFMGMGVVVAVLMEMAVQILHIVIMVFVFPSKSTAKVTGVQSGLCDSADPRLKPFTGRLSSASLIPFHPLPGPEERLSSYPR